MPEFTKTACKRWLVERHDLPSIAEVLTLRADLPAETSKSAHSWPNLPLPYQEYLALMQREASTQQRLLAMGRWKVHPD